MGLSYPGDDAGIKVATALPDQQPIPSIQDTALIGDIIAEGYPRSRAYIKVQSVEKIAKDALCAVLARSLHLPVQQPFYISMVHTEYAGQGNVESIAFGLLSERMPASRLANTQGIEDKLGKWPDLLKTAIFDEWIANRDRIPNNMVYEQGDVFWLCDHDNAFPEHATPATPINAQLLTLASRGKSEFELFRLRNEAMKIVAQFETIDWNVIYSGLQVWVLQSAAGFFDKYIEFLRRRLPELRALISQDLQIKQSEFTFSHSETSNVKSNAELRHEK